MADQNLKTHLLQVLFEDSDFLAVDKAAGVFVHPPERSPYPVPKEKILIHLIRKEFGQLYFPVHRLDSATSGVLLFAKNHEAASAGAALFRERQIEKKYWAVVRGHLPESGQIDLPLELNHSQERAEALTTYKRIAEIELPFAVGKKYSTSRYSWLEVNPKTGRWHQIRRHFDRISHPLIGDIEHGDSHHNRFFRDQLKISGLCLRSIGLAFQHPFTSENIQIQAGQSEAWLQIHKLFLGTSSLG